MLSIATYITGALVRLRPPLRSSQTFFFPPIPLHPHQSTPRADPIRDFFPSLPTHSHRVPTNRLINRKRRNHNDERLSKRIAFASHSPPRAIQHSDAPVDAQDKGCPCNERTFQIATKGGYLPVLLHWARKKKAVCGLALCVALEAHSHGHHHHDAVARIDTQPE